MGGMVCSGSNRLTSTPLAGRVAVVLSSLCKLMPRRDELGNQLSAKSAAEDAALERLRKLLAGPPTANPATAMRLD